MKLSSKSWHRKLYDISYEDQPPKSLCPYFWKIVLAVILVVPLTVFEIPFKILTYYVKREDGELSRKIITTESILLSFVLNGIITTAICMVGMWFTLSSSTDFSFAVIGLGIIGWGLLMVIAISKLSEKLRDRKPRHREHKPNILIEYLKAKKDKICPLIEWE